MGPLFACCSLSFLSQMQTTFVDKRLSTFRWRILPPRWNSPTTFLSNYEGLSLDEIEHCLLKNQKVTSGGNSGGNNGCVSMTCDWGRQPNQVMMFCVSQLELAIVCCSLPTFQSHFHTYTFYLLFLSREGHGVPVSCQAMNHCLCGIMPAQMAYWCPQQCRIECGGSCARAQDCPNGFLVNSSGSKVTCTTALLNNFPFWPWYVAHCTVALGVEISAEQWVLTSILFFLCSNMGPSC